MKAKTSSKIKSLDARRSQQNELARQIVAAAAGRECVDEAQDAMMGVKPISEVVKAPRRLKK